MNVLTVQSAGSKAFSECASGPSVPISFLKKGESGKVVRISGKKEVKTFLEGLGFVPGTSVKMVNNDTSGRILEIRGSRIAIDNGMAMKIMVSQ